MCLDTEGRHTANYRMRGAGIRNNQCCIRRFSAAWLPWAVAFVGFPIAQVLENLFNELVILDKGGCPHPAVAPGTHQRVHSSSGNLTNFEASET